MSDTVFHLFTLGSPTDEAPDEVAEAPDLEDGLRIRDRGLDLQPVPDDARVAHQPLNVARPEARHRLGVEAGEGGAVTLSLVQDRRPRKPCLRAFEHEHLEEMPLVPRRDAPFLVVVGDVERVAFGNPGAARVKHRRDCIPRPPLP